jgi:hypothetical protein
MIRVGRWLMVALLGFFNALARAILCSGGDSGGDRVKLFYI